MRPFLRRRWRSRLRLRLGCFGVIGALALTLGALLTAALLAVPSRPSGLAPVGSRRWSADVSAAAATTGLSPALIRAVMITESNGNSLAVSRRGAQGLMQLEPATAHMVGVSDPWNPGQNVLGGARLLRSLLDRYRARYAACTRGSASGPCTDPLVLALAAYNAGPQAVDRYAGIPPYPETERYVVAVLTRYGDYLRAEAQARP